MKLFKIIIINIALFSLVMPLSFLSAFLAGYGSNSSKTFAGWRMYIGFFMAHVLINFVVLKFLKYFNGLNVLLSLLEIIILYGVVAWIYR